MRAYDGNIIADWDTPIDAGICPSDPAAREKWGWKQDEKGDWYRDIEDDQKLSEPPKQLQPV